MDYSYNIDNLTKQEIKKDAIANELQNDKILMILNNKYGGKL